jgi:hypothetical protein
MKVFLDQQRREIGEGGILSSCTQQIAVFLS